MSGRGWSNVFSFCRGRFYSWRKRILNRTELICLVSRQIRLATILIRFTFQVYVRNVWFVVNIIQICGYLMRWSNSYIIMKFSSFCKFVCISLFQLLGREIKLGSTCIHVNETKTKFTDNYGNINYTYSLVIPPCHLEILDPLQILFSLRFIHPFIRVPSFIPSFVTCLLFCKKSTVA